MEQNSTAQIEVTNQFFKDGEKVSVRHGQWAYSSLPQSAVVSCYCLLLAPHIKFCAAMQISNKKNQPNFIKNEDNKSKRTALGDEGT